MFLIFSNSKWLFLQNLQWPFDVKLNSVLQEIHIYTTTPFVSDIPALSDFQGFRNLEILVNLEHIGILEILRILGGCFILPWHPHARDALPRLPSVPMQVFQGFQNSKHSKDSKDSGFLETLKSLHWHSREPGARIACVWVPRKYETPSKDSKDSQYSNVFKVSKNSKVSETLEIGHISWNHHKLSAI